MVGLGVFVAFLSPQIPAVLSWSHDSSSLCPLPPVSLLICLVLASHLVVFHVLASLPPKAPFTSLPVMVGFGLWVPAVLLNSGV